VSIGSAESIAVEPDPGDPTRSVTVDRALPADQRPLTVVNAKVRIGQRLKDIWSCRELLVLLVRTDLKIKYKSSILGYLWSMLNPALVLAIYFVIFNIISKNGIPQFAIWLFSGLIVWNLFNNAAMTATGVVVGRAGIVKKVAFPRELLALSTVGVAIVLFVIQVGVLILALLVFSHQPSYQFLVLIPLAVVALIIFTSAISIFLSAVNVYLRDTQHLTEVLLMAWFWSIPVVYPYGLVASGLGKFRYVYLADPITPVVMTFERAIYGKTTYIYPAGSTTSHELLPAWGLGPYALLLLVMLVVSIALFFVAMVVFGRLEGNFAEEL
jgi:ABC-2 type transport system permease protein